MRYSHNIPEFPVRSNFFENTFFPSVISEWNKVDVKLCNATSIETFKKGTLKQIRPIANSTFNIFNPKGVRYITRLRLELSHLRYHKFNHNFQDSLNPLCSCNSDVENNIQFFLHCQYFTTQRQTLLNKIRSISENILSQSDEIITKILLFGDPKLSNNLNSQILNASIEFILSSERFDNPLI